MGKLVKLLKTTGISYTRDIRGFSPKIHSDGDCDGGNCEGGWGACDCQCDCTDD